MIIFEWFFKVNLIATISAVLVSACVLINTYVPFFHFKTAFQINIFHLSIVICLVAGINLSFLLFIIIDRYLRFKKEKINKIREHKVDLTIHVGTLLSTVLDKGKLLRIVIDSFCTFFEADYGFLLLLDLRHNEYYYEAGHGMNKTLFAKTKFSPEGEIYGALISLTEPITLHRLTQSTVDRLSFIFPPDKMDRVEHAERLISIPLKIEDRILAIVNVYAKNDQVTYFQQHRDMLSLFTNQMTVAVGSAIQSEFAILDRLTMLYNHEYFEIRFREELERSRRYKDHLSIFMFDIDHFKKFNDTYGHQVGDEVLKCIAKILKQSLRLTDLSARYGGEEFIVMLPKTSLEFAIQTAERIRQTVETYQLTVSGQQLQITISLGVVGWDVQQDMNITTDVLVKRADESLYNAKNSGRNRVCAYQPGSSSNGSMTTS